MNYDVMGGAKRSARSARPRTPLPYTTNVIFKVYSKLVRTRLCRVTKFTLNIRDYRVILVYTHPKHSLFSDFL